MKNTLLMSFALCLTLFAHGLAQASTDASLQPQAVTNANPQPQQVAINVNSVYIPGGFDSTSNVFVVESGIMQNGCYKWDHADVAHVSNYVHEVRTFAKLSPGMCLMVLIPFTKEVNIGRLAVGDHKIRMMSGDGTYFEKDLSIEE